MGPGPKLVTSILGPIANNLKRHHRDTAYVVLDQDGEELPMSGGDLLASVSAWAAALRSVGVGKRDVVLLALDHGQDLIPAFLGAIATRALPALLAYPEPMLERSAYVARVVASAQDIDAGAVICAPRDRKSLRAGLNETGTSVIARDLLRPEDHVEAKLRLPKIESNEMAYLQYSSGSTGKQKVVMLSHGAVHRQLEIYGTKLNINPRDVVVSWLPLYHDMGLVTSALLPLWFGIRSVMTSPFSWIRNPASLFRLIDRHNGTLCWMPNFAFSLCTKSAREREMNGVRIDSLRALTCGAEPVRHHTLADFEKRFKQYGLGDGVVGAGYGMAESTLAVSVSEIGEGWVTDWIDANDLQSAGQARMLGEEDSNAIPMVSSGSAIPGTEIRLVDDRGSIVPDRAAGELVMKSESLFSGYYRRPNLTDRVMHDGWFHTGDMAYTMGRNIFICGRKSDMIIVAGKNLYPEELEEVAARSNRVRPGRVVAFGIDDAAMGTEGVVLIAEAIEPSDLAAKSALEGELRRLVLREMEIVLADIRIVRHGWVKKTSSGKISRSANRAKYLGEFPGFDQSQRSAD